MRRPLFIGNSDVDQLFKIFAILGLPAEKDWPENSVIPLDSFSGNGQLRRVQGAENLRSLAPALDDQGLDLLARLLDFCARLFLFLMGQSCGILILRKRLQFVLQLF